MSFVPRKTPEGVSVISIIAARVFECTSPLPDEMQVAIGAHMLAVTRSQGHRGTVTLPKVEKIVLAPRASPLVALQLVAERQPVSRKQITAISGLTRSKIYNDIATLTDLSLIQQDGAYGRDKLFRITEAGHQALAGGKK